MEERRKAILNFFNSWWGWQCGPKDVAARVKYPVVNVRKDLEALAAEGKILVVAGLRCNSDNMPCYSCLNPDP